MMLTHSLLRIAPLALAALTACDGGRLPSAARDAREATPTPLLQAHAHNDYQHERPLLDALSFGFMSVEADVYAPPLPAELTASLAALPALVDLYVAHDPQDIRPERTLRTLYLEPLMARFAEHGAIYPGQSAPLQLLIDFKTEAETTWHILEQQLTVYDPMLTRYDNGRLIPGAVSVVISGNRPTDTLAALPQRLAFIDGRLGDLEQPLPVELMPLISDNWNNVFDWQGDGPMPQEERELLRSLIQRTHALGARLRFWATPDTPGPARDALWTVLATEGQDHINSDDLAGLSAFLQQHAAEPSGSD